MSQTLQYGVYGVGRIGKVHAAIVLEQGQRVITLGDDEPAAVAAAQLELGLVDGQLFNDPAEMARVMGEQLDAMIIASHTKDHARHALPFVQAGGRRFQLQRAADLSTYRDLCQASLLDD